MKRREGTGDQNALTVKTTLLVLGLLVENSMVLK